MHHEDLTAPVLAGLAWYYLLAAMMNAAAAAYVAYGEMVSAGGIAAGAGAQDAADAGLAGRQLLRALRPGRADHPVSRSRCRVRSRSPTACVRRPMGCWP